MNNPFREDNLSKEDFLKKYKEIFYKTNNSIYGKEKTEVDGEKGNGLNGKFTSHLLASGMWTNDSLNTAVDRDRYINGGSNWMDNLS